MRPRATRRMGSLSVTTLATKTAPLMRTKTVKAELDEDNGRVLARFATLGVIDKDGDIIEKGAIGRQEKRLMGWWNHAMEVPAPGYGVAYEDGDDALYEGTFLKTNWYGPNLYNTIKELKDAGISVEWSFRFFIQEGGFEVRDEQEAFSIKKLEIAHVAPVEVGAGVNTATLDVKSCGPECQAAMLAGAAPEAQKAADPTPTEPAGVDIEKIAGDISRAIAEALAAALGVKAEGGDANLVPATLTLETNGPETTLTDAESASNGPETDNTAADAAADQQVTDNPDADATKTLPDASTKGQRLGDLLRELRDEKELTNDDLANAAGLSVGSIGGILAGTTECPKIGQLQGLARRLGVNLSRLVAAAESDGCEQYEGDGDDAGKSAGDEQQVGKAVTDDAPSEATPGERHRALVARMFETPVGETPAIYIHNRIVEKMQNAAASGG